MKKNTKLSVIILIMEDDIYYNNLLCKKIRELAQKDSVKKRINVQVTQYTNPNECLNLVKNIDSKEKNVLAFIDYYLGNGINGAHLIRLLNKNNKGAKIVLISQSEKALKHTSLLQLNNMIYSRLVKHEYSVDFCSIIAENYLNNLMEY